MAQRTPVSDREEGERVTVAAPPPGPRPEGVTVTVERSAVGLREPERDG